MKILRSVKLHFTSATKKKQQQIHSIMDDYKHVVNLYIDIFWVERCREADLKKELLDRVQHPYFTQRLKQQAAREALSMVNAAIEQAKAASKEAEREVVAAVKPTHYGNRMALSTAICSFTEAKQSKTFDRWLSFRSIGDKIKIDIPIKLHRQFHKWNARGRLMGSFVIFRNYVQVTFEIQTGEKKPITNCVGIDTGINALASLSTGEQIGLELKELINIVRRRKKGSKGKKRAIKTLKDYIALNAKRIVMSDISLIVVERLKGITHGTKLKGRLSKNMRSVIGSWNVRYWLTRLEMLCEENRVSFRRVWPENTSITCRQCGYVDKKNRNGEIFLCQSCGHRDNADINASRNILNRFFTGPYGAGYEAGPILLNTIG